MKHHYLISVIIFCLSCVSTPATESQSLSPAQITEKENPSQEPLTTEESLLPDIEAIEINLPPYDPPGEKGKNNPEYVQLFNQFVEEYNKGNYPDAAAPLLSIIQRFDDAGQSLFYLGLCYLGMKEFEKGLQFLTYSRAQGFDSQGQVNQQINYAIFSIGYKAMGEEDYVTAIAYYKKALQFQEDEVTLQNILFSYIKLAARFKGKKKLEAQIHALKFIDKYKIENSNVPQVVLDFTNTVLEENNPAYFKTGETYALYALKQEDNPFIHQNLGMIYLMKGEQEKAAEEFKYIITRHKNSEAYETSLVRYYEALPVTYQYTLTQLITISPQGAFPFNEGELEVIILAPQEYNMQKVKELKVTFNNQAVKYEELTDSLGAHFLSFKIKGQPLKQGANTLKVQALVTKSSYKTPEASLKGITIKSYNTQDPLYVQLTRSTDIIDFSHPQVRVIKEEILKQLTGDLIEERIQAVYRYVMDRIEYNRSPRGWNQISTNRIFQNNFQGNCEDYAILSTALLRSMGIPSSCFIGDTFNTDIGHAWTVVYTPEGKLVTLDATWGDTSLLPDYYYLLESNQNITLKFGFESDVLPENQHISLKARGINVEIGQKEYSIKLVP